MKRVRPRALAGIVLVLVAVAASLALYTVHASAQNDVVATLVSRLTEKGVPVKEAKVLSRLPLRVQVTIQSKSQGTMVAPEDTSFKHAAVREAALAQRWNARFDALTVMIVNTRGEAIYWADEPVRHIPEVTASPGRLDDASVAELARAQIALHGLSLDKLDVATDEVGAQTLSSRLSTKDVQSANEAVPGFMEDLMVLPYTLNTEHHVQIVICKVEIVNATGELLLKFTRDDQVGRMSWWLADGVRDWLPHP